MYVNYVQFIEKCFNTIILNHFTTVVINDLADTLLVHSGVDSNHGTCHFKERRTNLCGYTIIVCPIFAYRFYYCQWRSVEDDLLGLAIA